MSMVMRPSLIFFIGLAILWSSQVRAALDPILQGLVSKIEETATGHFLTRPSRPLSSLATSRLHVNDQGEVQVYLRVDSVNESGMQLLAAKGFKVERVLAGYGLVQGRIAYDRLDFLAEEGFVQHITLPAYARTRTGSTVTEGDALMQADDVRQTLGFTGDGIAVGVISDGVAGIFDSVASSDLPAGTSTSCDPDATETAAVVCESFNDAGGIAAGAEGTAMLEIVHDLAPGASLFFCNPSTSVDMVSCIEFLAGECDIIVDDLGFYNEPFFADGPVALAAQAAIDDGVVYVSAAGNDAEAHVQEAFNDTDGDGFHNYDTTGLDSYLVALAAGDVVFMDMQWDDDFDSATNEFDLIMDLYEDEALTTFVETASDTTDNTGGTPAAEIIYENTSGATLFGAIQVQQNTSDGSAVAFEIFPFGIADAEFFDPEDSIFGHPAVADAIAVGAIAQDDEGNDDIESYSSQGPATAAGEARDKPEVAGIDNVAVTANGGFINPFPGTSAAAPHVAACLALMLEAAGDTTLSMDQIRTALMDTSVDLGAAGLDFIFGAGLVDCLAAVAAVQALVEDDDDGAGTSGSCALAVGVSKPLGTWGWLFFSVMVLLPLRFYRRMG